MKSLIKSYYADVPDTGITRRDWLPGLLAPEIQKIGFGLKERDSMKNNKEFQIGFRVTGEEIEKIKTALKEKSNEAGFEVRITQFIRHAVMLEVDRILTKS